MAYLKLEDLKKLNLLLRQNKYIEKEYILGSDSVFYETQDDENSFLFVVKPQFHPFEEDLLYYQLGKGTVFFVCKWGIFAINSEDLISEDCLYVIEKLKKFKPHLKDYVEYSQENEFGEYTGLCPLQKKFLEDIHPFKFFDWETLLTNLRTNISS